jgi:ribosomal-protein-alanine N-acetyltransferase
MEEIKLEIGEYEEGDLREIVAIERDSFLTPWSENIFRNEMTCPISRMLVGRSYHLQKRLVAAYLVYWSVEDEIHIHNIAVRPELRRNGIATRMLEEALRRSRREDAHRVTLEVRRSNLPAQRMYEKFGFSVKGVRPGYYSDTREDALIMWADLQLIHLRADATVGKSGVGDV